MPPDNLPKETTNSRFPSFKKVSTPILIFMVLLAVILLIALIAGNKMGSKSGFPFLNKTAPSSSSQLNQPAEQKSMSGLQIAEKIALFLKKAQRQDGSFYLQYRCSPTIQDKCVVQMHEGPDGQITLVFLELYKKTGKTEYKKIADRAVEYQLGACKKKILACELAFTALAAYYDQTKDSRYKDAMVRADQYILSARSLSSHLANNDGGKLELLYRVTGEEKYRSKLVTLADRFLSGEFKNQSDEAGFAIADYAYLPAYRVTNDNRYLEGARAIFTKADLSSSVSQFEQKENSYPLIIALDALITLSQDGSSFRDDAKSVEQFLLRTLWDNPQNKKFVADNGFVHYFGNKDPNFKYVVNSGWIALSSAKMEKETFTTR